MQNMHFRNINACFGSKEEETEKNGEMKSGWLIPGAILYVIVYGVSGKTFKQQIDFIESKRNFPFLQILPTFV